MTVWKTFVSNERDNHEEKVSEGEVKNVGTETRAMKCLYREEHQVP